MCFISSVVYWIYFHNIHTFLYKKTLLHALFSSVPKPTKIPDAWYEEGSEVLRVLILSILHMIPWNSPNSKMDEEHICVGSTIQANRKQNESNGRFQANFQFILKWVYFKQSFFSYPLYVCTWLSNSYKFFVISTRISSWEPYLDINCGIISEIS